MEPERKAKTIRNNKTDKAEREPTPSGGMSTTRAGEKRPPQALTRDQEMQKEVLSRLKKIEGQVRGVQKMIQDCRACGDIVIQLAAIKAAINRVGITVLGCHLAEQIDNDLRENRNLKDSLDEFMGVFKKFS